MKRIALAVLTVALVLSLLVGCAGPATPTANPSPTATSASPTPTSGVIIVGVWEQLPLYGGTVLCLTIDPSNHQVLYAGTGGGGVWKSSDGGGEGPRGRGKRTEHDQHLAGSLAASSVFG